MKDFLTDDDLELDSRNGEGILLYKHTDAATKILQEIVVTGDRSRVGPYVTFQEVHLMTGTTDVVESIRYNSGTTPNPTIMDIANKFYRKYINQDAKGKIPAQPEPEIEKDKYTTF